MRRFKKFLKILLMTILVLIVGVYLYLKYSFFIVPKNQLTVEKSEKFIPFKWASAMINNEMNRFAAILLPVQIKGCPKTFYMQFDLGTHSTEFYKNKLEAINQKFINNIPFETDNGKTILTNYTFHLNEIALTSKRIKVNQYDTSTINWSDTTTNEIIGTIGSDFIENKTIVIDYPNSRILLTEKLPDSIKIKTKFTKFKYVNRTIFIPAKVGDDETEVLFDTGASTFEFLTTKSKWNKLAKKNAKVSMFEGASWGNVDKFYTTSTDDSIKYGNLSFPLNRVSYMDNHVKIANWATPIFLKIISVGGSTGNKLFLDKIIIFDTKNLDFGIVVN
jgi:hypothetical protein